MPRFSARAIVIHIIYGIRSSRAFLETFGRLSMSTSTVSHSAPMHERPTAGI